MEERLRNAPCGFLSTNHEGFIIDANDTFLNEMNYERETLIGQHMEFISRPATRMIFHSYFYPTINLYGQVKELYVKLKKRTGEEVPFLINARQLQDEDDYHVDIVLLPMVKRMEYEQQLRQTKLKMEEILKEKEAAHLELQALYAKIKEKKHEVENMNQQLVVLSHTDKLTNIPNRRHYQKKLDEIVSNYWNENTNFSLLIMDIDYFKHINDSYGHQVGDQVLIQVASILSENLPKNAFVARYGGEEFVVLLPGMLEREAMEVAENLKDQIALSTWEVVDKLTISVGAATYSSKDNQYTIITKADQALYFSKENGRNRATHFNSLY